jgi:hypothetical protein
MTNLHAWQVAVTVIVLLFLGGVAVRWGTVLWSVFKASKMASQGVSTLLEEAAEVMMADPPQQWVVGCLHLLKAIEIRVDDREYRTALKQVEAEIDVRLETGRWPERQALIDTEQGEKG